MESALQRQDPKLQLVYLAWFGHFDGDASAPQLIRHFLKRGHRWANVNATTMLRWMKRIEDTRNQVLLSR